MKGPGRRARRGVLFGGLLCAALGTAGCLSPGDPRGLDPVARRLVRVYPDLASGRLVILASFEQAEDARLFRVTRDEGGAGDAPQPEISVFRSREGSGVGSLRAELRPGECLRCDGARSERLALIRDWSASTLLLASVLHDGPPVAIETAIEGGPEGVASAPRRAVLSAGWNLLRFDLEELADEVNLTDVRAIRWRLPEARESVVLHLDDLVLANNTRALSADAPAGAALERGVLRGEIRGKRTCFAVEGRFELGLADGLVSSWRAASRDNLTVFSGLGPLPTPLPPDWLQCEPPVVYDDPQLFAGWGEHVAAGQGVVEASAFRAVVRGRWRFGAEPPASTAVPDPVASGPTIAWQTTIYPSGQVFVRVELATASAAWPAGAHLGWTVAVDGRRGFEPLVGDASGPRFVLFARGAPGEADLLWVMHEPAATPHVRLIASDDERRVAATVGAAAVAERIVSSQMLRVWPADIDSAAEARSIADDYQHPAALTFQAGQSVADAAGDENHDGYNEGEGCYELRPANSALRFTFEPRGRLRFDPVFRVHDSGGARCWVYADGRIVATTGRDSAGRLLISLPGVITRATAVEVVIRGGASEADAARR
ncbi:MAG: hypothetical protein CHACPFDD_04137 [Phycisphaerae bacterium]|nr:hypothetical protein [Phycisphaerae bacterium]